MAGESSEQRGVASSRQPLLAVLLAAALLPACTLTDLLVTGLVVAALAPPKVAASPPAMLPLPAAEPTATPPTAPLGIAREVDAATVAEGLEARRAFLRYDEQVARLVVFMEVRNKSSSPFELRLSMTDATLDLVNQEGTAAMATPRVKWAVPATLQPRGVAYLYAEQDNLAAADAPRVRGVLVSGEKKPGGTKASRLGTRQYSVVGWRREESGQVVVEATVTGEVTQLAVADALLLDRDGLPLGVLDARLAARSRLERVQNLRLTFAGYVPPGEIGEVRIYDELVW